MATPAGFKFVAVALLFKFKLHGANPLLQTIAKPLSSCSYPARKLASLAGASLVFDTQSEPASPEPVSSATRTGERAQALDKRDPAAPRTPLLIAKRSGHRRKPAKRPPQADNCLQEGEDRAQKKRKLFKTEEEASWGPKAKDEDDLLSEEKLPAYFTAECPARKMPRMQIFNPALAARALESPQSVPSR